MRPLLLLILLTGLCLSVHAQKVAIPKNLTLNDEVLAAEMPHLAAAVLQQYTAPHNDAYWDNLLRLNLVARRYKESVTALDSMLAFLKNDTWEATAAIGIQYRSYALAKLAADAGSKNFATVFNDTLDVLFNRLPAKAKPWIDRYLITDTTSARVALEIQLNRLPGKDSLAIPEAIALIRAYNTHNIMRQVVPLGQAYLQAAEQKYYISQDSLLIPGANGSQLSAVVYRKKALSTGSLPVVLLYNIYASPRDKIAAKVAAEYGYAGVVVNTRGKHLSPQEVAPFEYDGADAYAVIDWLSKQPWCNGKIGMYGGSYLGFGQWSATKKLHPALKTIVPQVAVGIGIDYPMHNGVFMSYMLQWIHYVSNNKLTDQLDFGDRKWDSLYSNWYRSGKSFRSLDTLDGRPNVIFQRWLDHSTLDNFWQSMVPYQKEFANINIPVLTTTGYFDADQRGAFYYFNEHNRWNKKAQHYLLIGPYDHGGAQSAAREEVMGYKIDPVANININETVWEWFDHHLKGGTFPARLKDKINYQVMGANEWRSAPSLKALQTDSIVFYLSNVYTKDGFKLDMQSPKQQSFLVQEVSYTDRSNVNLQGLGKLIVDSSLLIDDGIKFISEPLQQDIIMTGSLEGELRLILNKKDIDLSLELYELMPDGKYFALSNTLQRASFIKDRTKRILLKPGIEESIPVYNSFFTSKKISKGSRLVMVAGMNKNPNWQINYGTGKDVSLETIEDGRVPVEIRWSNKSYIKIYTHP